MGGSRKASLLVPCCPNVHPLERGDEGLWDSRSAALVRAVGGRLLVGIRADGPQPLVLGASAISVSVRAQEGSRWLQGQVSRTCPPCAGVVRCRRSPPPF